MTDAKPTPDWMQPFWEALRPDPLPAPPGWLTPQQRTAWLLGAREGIAQGRELERKDRERWSDG